MKANQLIKYRSPRKELVKIYPKKGKALMLLKYKNVSLQVYEAPDNEVMDWTALLRWGKEWKLWRKQQLLTAEFEKLNEIKVLTQKQQRWKEIVDSGPVDVHTIDFDGKKVSLVEIVSITFESGFVPGRRIGSVIGPGDHMIYVIPGTRGHCATSLEGDKYFFLVEDQSYLSWAKEKGSSLSELLGVGEKKVDPLKRGLANTRMLAARGLAVDGWYLLMPGFGSFDEAKPLTARRIARSKAVNEARAVVKTLRSVDPSKWLEGEDQKLDRAAAKGDLNGVNEALGRIERLVAGTEDKWLARARGEAAAFVAAETLLYLDSQAPLPRFSGVEGGEALLKEMFKRYDTAKASTSESDKTEFVQWLDANVLPKLTDTRTIQQIFGMLLAYLNLPIGTQVTVYPLGEACPQKLVRTVVQRTRSKDYSQFREKGLPPYASVSAQIWEGIDSQGRPLLTTVFRGTASLKAQDALARQKQHTTGASSNADPSGVGHSGFLNQRSRLARALLELDPKKSKIHLFTGHSLGGATSFDGFICALSLGFNAHYVGFNPPGTSHATMGLAATLVSQRTLSRRAVIIADRKDWIPAAGHITPPCRIVLNSTTRWARSGLLPIKFDDWFLGHGSINHIVRDLVGEGYEEEIFHASDMTWPIVERFRPSTAYGVFTSNLGEKRFRPSQFESIWRAYGWLPDELFDLKLKLRKAKGEEPDENDS